MVLLQVREFFRTKPLSAMTPSERWSFYWVQHAVTLFEQILLGWDFENDIWHWSRDGGLVRTCGTTITGPGGGKPHKPLRRDNEGAESSGDDFLSLGSGVFLLWICRDKWHLGTSLSQHPKNLEYLRFIGCVLVIDDCSVYLKPHQSGILSICNRESRLLIFLMCLEVLVFPDHEKKLWKYSLYCKATKFMNTNLYGTLKAECSVMLWHFL